MLQQFTCNGKSISRLQSNGFFNLTELVDASDTGKRLDNWFRLKETYQYVTLLAENYFLTPQDLKAISTLSSSTTEVIPHILHDSQDKELDPPQLDLGVVSSKYRSIPNVTSVMFTVRGYDGGTWGHPTLAINLMRWTFDTLLRKLLSPAFALWCDEHILRLLDTGKTSLLPDNMILNPSQYEDVRHLATQAEVSTQLRQFKYAVDYTDSLYRERDIVLRYREQGLPDYETFDTLLRKLMYLLGEIIYPCYFDREYEMLIRNLTLWTTKIQEFEGQPELQEPYLNSLHKHFNFVRQRISLLFSLPDRRSTPYFVSWVLNNNTQQQQLA